MGAFSFLDHPKGVEIRAQYRPCFAHRGAVMLVQLLVTSISSSEEKF